MGPEPRFFGAACAGSAALAGAPPAEAGAAGAGGGRAIRCGLCPRRCEIRDGGFGDCGARGNRGGRGFLPYFGRVTALALDPIEKKPLYHFRPGSQALSVGFAGCNLRCPFCQNWRISRALDPPSAQAPAPPSKALPALAASGGGGASGDPAAGLPGRSMRPAELVSEARRCGSGAIAYTYSEPLVHAEFLLDCMALARKSGIAGILVTNGCVCSGPAEEILSLADAASIDLKCFSRAAYERILAQGAAPGALPDGSGGAAGKSAAGASGAAGESSCAAGKSAARAAGGGAGEPAPGEGMLEAVKAFARLASAKGVHVEVATLVVPGLSDSPEELDACADFVASLGAGAGGAEPGDAARLRGGDPWREAPWHLLACRPAHLWKGPPVDSGFLLRARERAAAKLRFAYAGGFPGGASDTLCPFCGALLVRRLGHGAHAPGLAAPKSGGAFFACAACGGETRIAR